jgi:hypothetical protein
MRHPLKHFALVLLLLAGCAQSERRPDRPALLALLRETKFEPHGEYTGVDTPEDRKPLQAAVDSAIADIRTMPDPLRKDPYATEDRDEADRYAIRIWRAAGFREESGLFPVADETVLASPLSRLRSRSD